MDFSSSGAIAPLKVCHSRETLSAPNTNLICFFQTCHPAASPPRPTGRYAVFSRGMKFSKQIRSDYFPVKPGHGCRAVPRCCADEADALDTALPPLLGEQSSGGFQPHPEELQGQPRPSPVALVKPFACSMFCSRASSEKRGAEHGPTSVPKFLCALEIIGQHPKGIEITKI